MPVRILLLEDSPLDAELICEHLLRGPVYCTVDRVSTRAEYRDALAKGHHDLILSDYAMPAFDGLAALDIAREQAPDTPFIFISGMFGEETATETLKRGATDYVLKQRMNRLPAAVQRALKEAGERRERKRAEERTRLLVAELSHRVKNTLATVVAIAQQTFQKTNDIDEFRAAFMGRIEALADAHGLLFQANWNDLDLAEVIDAALRPFRRGDGKSIQVDGGPIRLPPTQALTLNLIVHELATNAAKYGALSREGGEVRVGWTVDGYDGDRRLRLEWKEAGGPEVTPPKRRGFGSTLIERSLTYEFDGAAELDFQPEGLVCRLSLPLPVPPLVTGLTRV
jgi:two-component sensor histidine kinase/CheY-like chemotaxis protein